MLFYTKSFILCVLLFNSEIRKLFKILILKSSLHNFVYKILSSIKIFTSHQIPIYIISQLTQNLKIIVFL